MRRHVRHRALLLSALSLFSTAAHADSGFYIGGSAGGATLEGDLGPTAFNPSSAFDEDDTAFKVFGGYTFDVPTFNLGVEVGYVDFGEPEIDILGPEFTLDTTGINLWGIAGIDVGPVDLFAKLGYVAWDIEARSPGISASEDGTDLGYGVGLGFGVGPVQIRGEFEAYDLDGDTDLTMLSLGLVYRFD